jgi:hypothetical protein
LSEVLLELADDEGVLGDDDVSLHADLFRRFCDGVSKINF